MSIERVTKSFVIENTELERYSLNLLSFFIEHHDYAIFNFEEKILENFNHPYYNIIMVYSSPLHNDVNIESFIEKLLIIKRNLLVKFLVFNPRILVVSTNCTLDLNNFDLPKHVEWVNATEKEKLLTNEIFTDIYSEVKEYNLDLTFESLTFKINMLNIEYAKRISKVFNKKHKIGNILLISLLMSTFLFNLFFRDYLNYFILTKENLLKNLYFTIITTTLYEPDLFSLIISVFLLLTLGIRIEKIFGTFRYLLIILFSIILANTTVFAFAYHEYPIGFTPIIYTLISAFIYVFILYRRFLAFTIKRVFAFIIFFFILFLVVLDLTLIYSMLGALIGGFLTSFIIGVPKASNGNWLHRMLAILFYLIFITLNLMFSL